MQMRMMGMIETLLKNQERSQTVQPPTTTSTTESGIAEQYTLSHEELRSIYQASSGARQFRRIPDKSTVPGTLRSVPVEA
ncbi:hypothetical protein DPMN_044933 [Dreissena polymorpha]|uniref:Uncharacterized protein n=1 Tax=Dreissena polymorpha TaxID=45954 RepID=A0A9D4D437_DREPO|nr:hypothetical protein DPMN_044933 [Dreissena polymorpha]